MAKDDDVVPGLVLEPSLEAKLDNLDDNLNPISEDLKEDEKPEDKSEEDTPEVEEEEPEDKEDEPEQPEESDKKTGTEEDGYTIDEGEEEVEKPTDTPQEDAALGDLNPEQKYIIDNLQPITVRGTIGTSEDVKEYKVYSPEYLPQGFKFVDDREMSAASKSFSMLEQRATQLQSDYRGQETQKAATDFKQREDAADRQDIATLQRAGEIPRFKAERDSADFDKDPGVQLAQEVIDFKEAQNAKYLEEYNAGRPYKHIGFEEAFRIYQRQNPTKSNPAQEKEDKERKDIANRTSKTNGTTSKGERPTAQVHSGMTAMDLENLIELKTAGW